jgi:hypothetical protein
MRHLHAYITLIGILITAGASHAEPAQAARASTLNGEVSDLNVASTIVADQTSPPACSGTLAPPLYKLAKRVLSVRAVVSPTGIFTPPAPEAGTDGGAAGSDGGFANAGPYAQDSIEILLKDAKGSVLLSSRDSGTGVQFDKLGAEVCAKGPKDRSGSMAAANNEVVEFCVPVTVTSLAITAEEKAAYEASTAKACAANNANSGCALVGTQAGSLGWIGLAAIGITLGRRRKADR